MTSRPRVHVALLVTQILFASLAVEGKVAMAPPRSVSPFALAMARILGGALVFIVAAKLLDSPRVTSWKDRAHLALMSLFGIVLNQALFLAGLSRTSPMSATLLVATIPVFTAAVASIAGRDRFTVRSAAGIGLALTGVATLSGFALPPRGDLFVLLNALSYSLYIVFAKELVERYGPVTVMAWVFGSGAVLFAPIGGVALVRDAAAWSASARELVAFIIVFPTILAYLLNAWALRRASPTLTTIYIYFQPVVVALLAYVQLGLAVSPLAIVAGVCIFAGVGIVATTPRNTS